MQIVSEEMKELSGLNTLHDRKTTLSTLSTRLRFQGYRLESDMPLNRVVGLLKNLSILTPFKWKMGGEFMSLCKSITLYNLTLWITINYSHIWKNFQFEKYKNLFKKKREKYGLCWNIVLVEVCLQSSMKPVFRL